MNTSDYEPSASNAAPSTDAVRTGPGVPSDLSSSDRMEAAFEGLRSDVHEIVAERDRLRESNDLGWQIVLDLLAAISPQAGKRVMETSIYREYKAALKATSRAVREGE